MTANSAESSRELRELYQRIDGMNLAPLWEVLGQLVPPQPNTPCVPALWRYGEVRPFLLEAGQLISAQRAERRVLVLENPGLRGASAITRSLYAGLQLILPGEVALSHRHTQSALRFVIEGTGAFTSVAGERAMMNPGDFIITPAWTFHDHGNPGESPVVWLDGLDIPIVAFFGAGFAERDAVGSQAIARADGDALVRYGTNLLPIDYSPTSGATPLLCYPYERTRAAIEELRRNGAPDPQHGFKMRYANPATGGYPTPTIAAFIQLLPKGFRGKGLRSTDGTVFSVVEGHGRSRIGDRTFDWGPKDTFVVPSWSRVAHESDEDVVLFSFSDRPVQQALGLWREERER